MRLTVRANVLLVICCAIAVWFAIFVLGRSSVNLGQGELRCESPGAVIINVGGDDYGVNAIGAWRYPPVQRIWNNTTYPETNIDRIINQGLTLCDWQSVSQSDRYAQR